MKVLVVEDSEDSRVLLKDNLLLNGYEVCEAENGLEALRILHEDQVDLIISDILMPQMDGFELCRIVKRNVLLKDIPFIFYTATYTHEKDEQLALAAGANRFIIKPEDPEKLIEIVKEVWEKSQHEPARENPVTLSPQQLDSMHIDALNRKLVDKNAELEKQKRQLILLTDAFPSLISELDSSQCYTFVNKAYEEWHHVSRDKIIGMHIRDLVGEHAYEIIGGHLYRALEGEVVSYESEVELKTGGHKFIHATYIPIRDEDEKVTGCYALVNDITLLKEQELKMQRMEKMDALGKLTGGIAHDFNNMLGVIAGYSDLLESKVSNDPQLESYVEQIKRATERAASLTEKLLNFSRENMVEAEVLNINKELSSMRDMLEKILTVKIELNIDLQEELWPVCINLVDLENAIVNLCINAMHAMKGGGKLFISTENYKVTKLEREPGNPGPGEYVKIIVEDQGSGIEPDNLSRIFEPFYSTKGNNGSGLGLTQVYGFVKRSKGFVNVESVVGKGTRFSLLIPRSEDDLQNSDDAVVTEDKAGQGHERILVVDDERALRELLDEILSNNGYKVLLASGGQEALDILKKENVDLVLSDIVMPNMTGVELKLKLNEMYPGLPFQFMSGYTASDSSHEEVLKDEVILYKPFTSSMAVETLQSRLKPS